MTLKILSRDHKKGWNLSDPNEDKAKRKEEGRKYEILISALTTALGALTSLCQIKVESTNLLPVGNASLGHPSWMIEPASNTKAACARSHVISTHFLPRSLWKWPPRFPRTVRPGPLRSGCSTPG